MRETEFLKTELNSASERELFKELYDFRHYNEWLKDNELNSTLDNLYAFKYYCVEWAKYNVWVRDAIVFND